MYREQCQQDQLDYLGCWNACSRPCSPLDALYINAARDAMEIGHTDDVQCSPSARVVDVATFDDLI